MSIHRKFCVLAVIGALLHGCSDPDPDSGSDGKSGGDGLDGGAGEEGRDGADAVDVDEDDDGVPLDRDCDDQDPSIGAPDLVYIDLDGDGFGLATVENLVCSPVLGWVDNASDCEDTNPDVHPDALEVCDARDNDCDGEVDDADDSVDPTLGGEDGFIDTDGDGHGDPDLLVRVCSVESVSGLVASGGDCDDGDAAIHPDAEEICGNGIDEDCDGGGEGCVLDGPYTVDDANFTLTSSDTGSQAGFAVATPDLDGDGIADIVLGVPSADTTVASGTGAVYIHFGATSFADAGVEDGVELAGTQAADILGYALVSPGDVDGDGADDLLVGDPGADRAYLVYGSASAWTSGSIADVAAVTISDGGAGYLLGYGVGEVGDLDGDGRPELAVGEYRGGGSFEGKLYLFFGVSSLGTEPTVDDAKVSFVGAASYDYAGTRSTCIGGGDFDGDGLRDLLVGARGVDGDGAGTGAVYLVSGPVSAYGPDTPMDDVDVILSGTEVDGTTTGFGASAQGVGDLDGDGVDDLAVGADYHDGVDTNAGAVFVWHGSTGGLTSGEDTTAALSISGRETGDRFGSSLGRVGDLDGDGRGDLLIYAPYADDPHESTTDVSGAFMFGGANLPASGTLGAGSSDAVVYGTEDRHAVGVDAAAGDIDGDALTDLVLGASGSGQAFVLRNPGY